MNSIIISSVLTFLVGVGIGMLVQRYVVNRGSKVTQLKNEIERLQGEQLHIKDSLEQHFRKTADLTNSLTDNYKALYQHLATGANEFTQQPLAEFSQLLEQTDKPAEEYIDYAAAGLDPQAVDEESKEAKESKDTELRKEPA